jgi:quercetin dioxygenase-like cupin family protein
MTEVEPWPRPDWTPVPRPGTTGVQTRLLAYTEGEELLAQLRFEPHATIDEHDAPYPIDVYCLEGAGFTSVDGEAAPVAAGQRVRWPAGAMHRLWTEGEPMTTLTHEHIGQAAEAEPAH